MVLVFKQMQIDGARPLQFICRGAKSEKFRLHFQNMQYFRWMDYGLKNTN
jgi:hypothetical protein